MVDEKDPGEVTEEKKKEATDSVVVEVTVKKSCGDCSDSQLSESEVDEIVEALADSSLAEVVTAAAESAEAEESEAA